MSNFGKRVIGKRAEQQQAALRKNPGNKFGTRVVSRRAQRLEQEAAAEAEVKASSPQIIDVGDAVKSTEPVVPVVKAEAPITANLDELEGALKQNPAFYETLYQSELERAEGPRKGALRLFLAHEMAGESREDRLGQIQGFLKSS